MYWRWVPAAQNDFAARLDWCVREFSDANHPPQVQLQGSRHQQVNPGQRVKLVAEASDPDNDQLTYQWWQYTDADSANSTVKIANADSLDEASFVIPDEPGKQVQIILEATDDGSPPLVGYQRVVFTIE